MERLLDYCVSVTFSCLTHHLYQIVVHVSYATAKLGAGRCPNNAYLRGRGSLATPEALPDDRHGV